MNQLISRAQYNHESRIIHSVRIISHTQFVSTTTVYKSMQSMVEHCNANTFRKRRKERSISEVFGMVYLFLRGRNSTIKERTLCLTLLPNGYSGIHLQANKIRNS